MKHSFFDQFMLEFKSLLKGYPKFVYSGNNPNSIDGIPVFVYHTIDPELFESHLKFLDTNGYNTLSIDDFYKIIIGEKELTNKKSILITIDDARSSVWKFGYPLLKKYNKHATVFVIPGLTLETDDTNLNLDNLWSGNCTFDELVERDKNDDNLCNWKEIEVMYNSGLVSIESHTLFHSEVFSSKKIVDLIKPSTKKNVYGFTGSPYLNKADMGLPINFKNYIGLPLFETSPTMLAGPKILFSNNFIQSCKNIFKEYSDDLEIVKEKIDKLIDSISFEDFSLQENSKNFTLDDLKTAKEIIQKKLDINAGNHLCLPWTKGNETTVKICKDLEIKSCFWGMSNDKRINKILDDPYYITRLKNDFIFRLPGKGRKSFISVYLNKFKRRLSGEKVY